MIDLGNAIGMPMPKLEAGGKVFWDPDVDDWRTFFDAQERYLTEVSRLITESYVEYARQQFAAMSDDA